MHPGIHAATNGDQPAVILGDSGHVVTYGQLERRSAQLANLLVTAGLRPGDHLAVMLENHPRYFEVFWAAMRAGLYLTPINWHLKPDEAGYIIEDCGATALVTSQALDGVVAELAPWLDQVSIRLAIDGDVDGFDRYERALNSHPTNVAFDEVEGAIMFYSSGTTGRPKGIKPPMSGAPFGTMMPPLVALAQTMWKLSSNSVYLCPAPLYHAAPLGWSTAVQRLGGTVVVMERFDAARALELIERHRVTHAQFVPTHFVRMLKLTNEQRSERDLSSLEVAIHAAAPCPVEVKEQMIRWWGPIVYEYYAGSEGNGFTAVGPEEWLEHRGTVGKALIGIIHILDEDGNDVAVGESGQVWFESPVRFEYHNDPDKTASVFNDRGWSTLGDVGYLDNEGYLYLTDRASHMIISGGVNIYPQEVENVLALHPLVEDVAIIGVPDPDMGEQVKAVVQLTHGADPDQATEDAILDFARSRLSAFKCPRSVDFVDDLPRLPTGKLLKRELRARYWV
ncbi:MAG: acyl-CoA synthetase [Mycetocola sp.]